MLMGRKPVLELAGALLTGLALAGCQSSNSRPNNQFSPAQPSIGQNQPANKNGPTVVVVPDAQCLHVYPLEAWERFVESEMRKKSPFDPGAREFGRWFASRGRDVEIDNAGRLLLTPAERQHAGLTRDVMLIGPAMESFEVWDRARFEAHERQEEHRVPELMAKFSAGHGS